MGREIFAATGRRADDAVSCPAETEQRGVDPAGTELRAEDFARRPDRKIIGFSAEINFPALTAENGILHLPAIRQPRKQPKSHRFVGVNRLDGQSQPCVGQPAELTQGGHYYSAIAAGGFFRAVLDRHFWKDKAGQRFLDFQREQAHGGRLARPDARSKSRFIRKSLFSGSENNLAPGGESGNALAAANLMAAKDNKKRGEVPEPTRWSNEITGIIWITAGLLLLLSLVKYSPADLPKWGPLEAMAGKSGAAGENLIGPVGGILGFVQILLFGAAGYLLPVGFIWFGIVKLAFDTRIWPRAVLGLSILLLTGSAWLDAADFFFKEWAQTCNLSGPGGVIGDGLGGFVLINVIGKTGTLILTSGGYLVAVIKRTGC